VDLYKAKARHYIRQRVDCALKATNDICLKVRYCNHYWSCFGYSPSRHLLV